ARHQTDRADCSQSRISLSLSVIPGLHRNAAQRVEHGVISGSRRDEVTTDQEVGDHEARVGGDHVIATAIGSEPGGVSQRFQAKFDDFPVESYRYEIGIEPEVVHVYRFTLQPARVGTAN